MGFNAAKLMLQVGADTSQADATLKGYVEKQAGLLQKGLPGLAAGIGLAATAAVVRQAGEYVTEAARMADANAKVEGSFEGLAVTAGQSGDAMLRALREASDGTIADTQLMLSANKAMLLGVADSAQEMADLMTMARARGQAMGLTAQQAFGDIVTGLGRASPLILDNLGIVVDLEQAYADYAAQIGTTSDALTEAEKKQALINATMEQASTADMGNVELMASNFEKAEASIANMKVALGELFGPAVAKVAEYIANAATASMEVAENVAEVFQPDALNAGWEALGRYERTGGTALRMLNALQTQTNLLVQEEVLLRRDAEDAQIAMLNAQNRLNALNNDPKAEFQVIIATEQEVERLQAAFAEVESVLNSNLKLQDELAMSTTETNARLAEQTAVLNQWLIPGSEHWNTYREAMDGTAQTGIVVGAAYDQLIERQAALNQWLIPGSYAWKQHQQAMEEYGDSVGRTTQQITAAQEQLAAIHAEMEGLAMSGAQQLFEAIGPEAWGYLDQLGATAAATFDLWYQKTGNAEIATYMARDAVSLLVAELGMVNGAGLDDVARGAVGATAELAAATAQANALNAALNRGVGSIQGLYLGALDVYGRQGAMQLEERMTAALEMQLEAASARGASERELMYIQQAWTNRIREGIDVERDAQQAQVQTTRATRGAGSAMSSAAKRVADGLRDLEGMLGRVSGLFDPTEVTQEDMDAAAAGRYRDKPDEYLRQLRDEMLNGVDWENVNLEEAAAAIGWTPEAARANAEMFINEFTAAWADSSLFADPANIDKFLNIDAVQAELQRQLTAAEGEKNLKALFGIGDDEDVNAIAALGLDVQSGLATWLSENGLDDAGKRLAEALGGGLKDSSSELGGGVTGGLDSFIGSPDGQGALYDLGERSAGAFAEGLAAGVAERLPDILPGATPYQGRPPGMGELPSTAPVTGPRRTAGAYGAGSLLPYGAGSVTQINNPVFNSPLDIAMLANQIAKRQKYRRV